MIGEAFVGVNNPNLLSTIEHAGNLIEHVSCSSAQALHEHIQRCNREGRTVCPSSPIRLPKNPAKRIDYFLSLEGADAVIEHSLADQVISVECGMTIAELRLLLSRNKQWFPVCLPDENISLMQYICGGSSGPLEHAYGEARDLVLGMQVVLGTAELIKCGGKVVKNVSGYDLPKLFAGSGGNLCIPFSAHLRLFALPEYSNTLLFRFDDLSAAFGAARRIRRSGLPISCLEIVDAGLLHKLQAGDGGIGSAATFPDGSVAVCTQIHGMQPVVAELENALVSIAGSSVGKEEISAESESGFWKLLSGPHKFYDCCMLELAASTRLLEILLNEIGKKSSVVWTCRSGRNKASLFLESSEELQDTLVLLADSSRANSERLTVAYADDRFLRKVQHLPDADPVLNELQHRLKHEYDPHGVLNPLVEF